MNTLLSSGTNAPIRRINLYAGPCAGKSTIAAKIFAALREAGFSVELSHEVVKEDAYVGHPIEGAYQMRRFGEQAYVEENRLKGGAKLLISDSPLPLQAYYTKSRGESFWTGMLEMANWMEEKYPSMSIFLDRTGIKYDQNGRFQTPEQAVAVDNQLKNFLTACSINFQVIGTLDFVMLLRTVMLAVESPKIQKQVGL